jgi:hypothetical protein
MPPWNGATICQPTDLLKRLRKILTLFRSLEADIELLPVSHSVSDFRRGLFFWGGRGGEGRGGVH